MHLTPNQLQSHLEQALVDLAKQRGPDLARQVKPILLINLDRGRVHRFLQDDPGRMQAYVRSVPDGFAALHEYLHRIQVERSEADWQPLYARMQTWAYNYFLRKRFAPDSHTLEIALECAAEAAVHLLTAHFPYDTDFDAWAHTLVLHACRKYITRSLKKSAVPEASQVGLEDDLASPEDLRPEANLLKKEQTADLGLALTRLSDSRRRVIELLYLEERTPQEASEILARTVGAVYTLLFHALRDLRKILEANRDNPNE